MISSKVPSQKYQWSGLGLPTETDISCSVENSRSTASAEALPKIIESSTTGGSRPSGGGVEENPLKSCLSVSRVETGTPGGGGCVLVRHVS